MINNIAPHIINPGYTKHNVIDEGFRISTWARIDRSNMNFLLLERNICFMYTTDEVSNFRLIYFLTQDSIKYMKNMTGKFLKKPFGRWVPNATPRRAFADVKAKPLTSNLQKLWLKGRAKNVNHDLTKLTNPTLKRHPSVCGALYIIYITIKSSTQLTKNHLKWSTIQNYNWIRFHVIGSRYYLVHPADRNSTLKEKATELRAIVLGFEKTQDDAIKRYHLWKELVKS